MEAILVLDIGTSSMRGILFNEEGQTIDVKRFSYSPEFLENNRVEQDPGIWKTHARNILQYFGNKDDVRIACIALSSGRSSVIPVDKNGCALSNAIMWHDRRTVPIVDSYADADKQIYDTSGIRLLPLVSAPKILWFKENEGELYKQTQYFLGIQDFLIHYLCDEFVTDYTFGGRTALMNIRHKKWDDDLLQLFGIDKQKLCTLIPPGTICGSLNNKMSKQTNIAEGTPILSAGGDQQCAALASGAFSEKHMLVNTGTGAYILQGVSKIVLDPNRGLFCNPSPIPDQYFVEASILTAGILCNWFGTLLFQGVNEDVYAKLNATIADSPPGARGLILFPWFEGRGSPFWNSESRGGMFNLSLRTERSDMLRAAVEAVALDVAENKEAMDTLLGKPERIHISGGFSAISVYKQVLADCLNTTLIESENREATSEGAWMVAAVALGIASDYTDAYGKIVCEGKTHLPNTDNASIYQKLLEKRKKLYASYAKVAE